MTRTAFHLCNLEFQLTPRYRDDLARLRTDERWAGTGCAGAAGEAVAAAERARRGMYVRLVVESVRWGYVF
jgi:hypothetical protein